MTRNVLVSYYAATALFLLLDYLLGINLRLAFLDANAGFRAAYYAFCFACLAAMLWRPAWTVAIAAFESLLTLAAMAELPISRGFAAPGSCACAEQGVRPFRLSLFALDVNVARKTLMGRVGRLFRHQRPGDGVSPGPESC